MTIKEIVFLLITSVIVLAVCIGFWLMNTEIVLSPGLDYEDCNETEKNGGAVLNEMNDGDKSENSTKMKINEASSIDNDLNSNNNATDPQLPIEGMANRNVVVPQGGGDPADTKEIISENAAISQ